MSDQQPTTPSPAAWQAAAEPDVRWGKGGIDDHGWSAWVDAEPTVAPHTAPTTSDLPEGAPA